MYVCVIVYWRVIIVYVCVIVRWKGIYCICLCYCVLEGLLFMFVLLCIKEYLSCMFVLLCIKGYLLYMFVLLCVGEVFIVYVGVIVHWRGIYCIFIVICGYCVELIRERFINKRSQSESAQSSLFTTSFNTCLVKCTI